MKTIEKNLAAQQAIAEVKEIEAKAELQRAKAEVKQTKAELETMSGVAGAKQRVNQGIANAKAFVAADLEQTKADFKHLDERLAAWDAATTRDLDARLDAADAQLAVWKAKADVNRVEERIQRHDDFAILEENIARARASAAEAKHDKYAAKAQAALEDAARAFDDAYDAAATLYNRTT